jgi:DNA-binding PadR family transcriptional regulator
MRKDDLKKTIVEMLSSEEMHGYEVQKQLTSRGLRLNISYLYRVLAEMERDGYIGHRLVKSTFGPEKKVYRLGEKGSAELDQELKNAVKIIHKKYIEYLRKLPPEKSAIRKLQRLLDAQVGGDHKILVVAPRVFYDWMISLLCSRFKEGKIYLVKPPSVKVNMESANLSILDATAENILLKDNFVDAVRVHGEPKNIHKALEEFHRVLRKDGSLALIVPYSRPQKDDYPLTMGEFVEKVEHEVSKEDKTELHFTAIVSLLSRLFLRVRKYRIAHLAILVGDGKK